MFLQVERINKRYTTENGLVFQTPELAYTSAEAVGPAADVYNLVLLMFWVIMKLYFHMKIYLFANKVNAFREFDDLWKGNGLLRGWV